MIITFAVLERPHFQLMHDWFNRPHMQQWWSPRGHTLAQVGEKYGPRVEGKVNVFGFIASVDERPAGYVQHYSVRDFPPDGLLDDRNELLRTNNKQEMGGMDVFIGEEELLGKGYGTAIVRAFLAETVFKNYRVAVIDPRVNNHRAIRCYEKCGFLRTQASQNPEFLLMVAERP